jgi:hypothetical protein
MSRHAYRPECTCTRCTREAARRTAQGATRAGTERTTPAVMLDWTTSRNPRRNRIARQYWDDFESGRPMSSDDY